MYLYNLKRKIPEISGKTTNMRHGLESSLFHIEKSTNKIKKIHKNNLLMNCYYFKCTLPNFCVELNDQ